MNTWQQKYDVFLRGIAGDSRIESDIVTPAQFYDRNRPEPSGAVRLLLGVLGQALDDLAHYRLALNPAARALFNNAYDWVFSDEEGWPYAFLRICEALGLAAGPIRAWVRAHYGEHRKRQPVVHLSDKTRAPEATVTFAPASCVGLSRYTLRYRLPNNRILNVGRPAVGAGTTAWMPGEVGTLVLTERYARSRGLLGDAPPPMRLRRVGGDRRPTGGLHEPNLTKRAQQGAA